MLWLMLACGVSDLREDVASLSAKVEELEADAAADNTSQVLLSHECTGSETYDHTWELDLEPGGPVQFWMWKRYSDEYIAWNDNTDEGWVVSTDISMASDGTITSTCYWYDTDDITGWYIESYILVAENVTLP